MEEFTFSIPPHKRYKRLDAFLASKLPIVSRSQIKKLIEEGKVLVDELPGKPATPLRGGEHIKVSIPPPERLEVKPERLPLDILYEDDNLIVINKPAGMVVHPGAGVSTGTLVNALLYHCKDLSGIGGKLRPGIVHRLDKGTSGVILVAKDDITHRKLAQQFRERKVKKSYLALVWGRVKDKKGVIDLPLGRHPLLRKQMSTITRKGREAITHYKVIEEFKDFALLDIQPETGRTHQIRVHLSTIHHPVVGDKVYGRKKAYTMPLEIKKGLSSLNGHALHAHTIRFVDPETGKEMEFVAPLNNDFKGLLNLLRRIDRSS